MTNSPVLHNINPPYRWRRSKRSAASSCGGMRADHDARNARSGPRELRDPLRDPTNYTEDQTMYTLSTPTRRPSVATDPR